MSIAFATFLMLTAGIVTDFRTRVIPNSLSYFAIVIGLLLGLSASLNDPLTSGHRFMDSLLGMAICFAAMFLAWCWLGVGGGDVKLATSIGSITGISIGISAIAYTYLIACGFTLIWLALGTNFVPQLFEKLLGFMPRSLGFVFRHTRRLDRRDMSREVPMAGFFAAGTACAFLMGPIL
jgi:Flp pilus assembly protein protease CpaA